MVVTLDLKQMDDRYKLWMVCSFTKYIKGVVIKDKTAETLLKSLHQSWCIELGFPMVGFWADNGRVQE